MEAEHSWAAKVDELQRQVDALQSRPQPEPALETAREFMQNMHHWLAGLALAPPPEVQSAADKLRTLLPAEAPLCESTPTDLAAPTTPAAVGSEDEEEAEDASMPAGKRAAAELSSREASADGREHRRRTPPPARRRMDAARAASR